MTNPFKSSVVMRDLGPRHAEDPLEDFENVMGSFEKMKLTDRNREGVRYALSQWAQRHNEPEPQVFWYGHGLSYLCVGEMVADVFTDAVGREPRQDDLHRVNCKESGSVGHFMCGWCNDHGAPRFQCGCFVQNGATG